jgi:MoaA/NifB/PqqE/SkfB family radical SAM enzyme
MNHPARTIKTVLFGLANSPVDTLGKIRQRLLPSKKLKAQVARMQAIAGETPLILQIETINRCNSACVFCAYPKMKRDKGTMTMSLFKKVVLDYAAMGGGPVSLTPIGGDALLDPHLIERIRLLSENPRINQVSLTTNAIALERYSDEDVRYLLTALDSIQVSIGGLDPQTYKTMYAVDRFQTVEKAIDRLLKTNNTLLRPVDILLAFRTNDPQFEKRFKERLDDYRRRGAFVSHISTYANYSGLVQRDPARKLVVAERPEESQGNCLYGCISMAVCWDGKITACGCADVEATALSIGHAERDNLADVWSGEKRRQVVDSFRGADPPNICRHCSAYLPDATAFSRPYFGVFEARQTLPPGFFREFWGG